MNTTFLNTVSLDNGKVLIKGGASGGNAGGGGGGGAAASAEGDVNFRDYDGTILHSHSKKEFLALSALPELPTQPGLICQEWNYTLEDAQSYVAENGKLDVGATYITDDGKTRLYISVAKGRQDVPLYFNQTKANGVTIDWGDGSAVETLSGTGNMNITHHYETSGDYVILLEVADGCSLGLGGSSHSLMGDNYSIRAYHNALKKVEIGQRATAIRSYAFRYCYSLASIVIPQGVTKIDSSAFKLCSSLASIAIPQGVTYISNYAFNYCGSLRSVTLPKGVTTIYDYAFQYCDSLASIIIPQGVTKIYSSAFYDCSSLASIAIPQGVTSIGSSAFYDCYSLASIVIPQGVTTIDTSTFYNCYSLVSIVIPKGVTSIAKNAFYYLKSIKCIDFRAADAVPTLASQTISGNPTDMKIVVPDELYDTWIAATNWSSEANKIVKASEYTD